MNSFNEKYVFETKKQIKFLQGIMQVNLKDGNTVSEGTYQNGGEGIPV
jgi:hypothetical protein